jgi:hypothetical protein
MNAYRSGYTKGDMSHAFRHLLLAVATRRGVHADPVFFAALIAKESNQLVAERSRRYTPNEQNAFRHQFGSCQLTRDVGEREARHTTDAHEDYLRPRNEEQQKDSEADQRNNNVGFRRGSDPALAHRSCAELADENIQAGSYWTPENLPE